MPNATDNTMLNERFRAGLALAEGLHRRQVRKSSDIPYFGHLMVVAGTVLEHGGDEIEATAALLHDAVEDQGGRPTLERIQEACGEEVAQIVEGCSDSLAADEGLKEDWKARKERYLDHLAHASASVRLVSAADKLHNARSLIRDLRQKGDSVWDRFNTGREDQLWFYREFVRALRRAGVTLRFEALIEELEDAVAELELLAEGGGIAHALAISARVHANQFDKAGAPYAMHPIRMMMRLDTDEDRIAALLHDVIEDVPGWSVERLRREGFSADVLVAIDALTKRKGEEYDAFIRRAAANPIARRVKQMDLEDNLNLLRLSSLRDVDIERLKKYHRHWLQLVGECSHQTKED